MNINWKIAIAVFLLGIGIDLLTTFYGLRNGFVELHSFSNILKIIVIIQLGILSLLKMKPEWIDLMFNVFCFSMGLPLFLVGMQNLILII